MSDDEVETWMQTDADEEYDDQSLKSNCEDCMETFATLNPKQTVSLVLQFTQ